MGRVTGIECEHHIFICRFQGVDHAFVAGESDDAVVHRLSVFAGRIVPDHASVCIVGVGDVDCLDFRLGRFSHNGCRQEADQHEQGQCQSQNPDSFVSHVFPPIRMYKYCVMQRINN